MRKKLLFILAACSFSGLAIAQDDLLADMQQDSTVEESVPVYATFKSTRALNGHSVEIIAAKHLDFRISHRFGEVKSGWDLFYGLDQATMRMGFEYGLNRNMMVGVGRTSIGQTVDGFYKVKVLSQKTGYGSPVTATIFTSIACVTQKWADPTRNNFFTSRLSYTNQILVARKFSDIFSMQLMPTHIHKNLVATKKDNNDIFALGIATSLRITRSTRFNMEYYPVLNRESTNTYVDCFSVGFDIETGGHVFQMHFTNGRGLLENQFITETNSKWLKGGLRFAFNISRTFSFDNSRNK